MIPVSFLTKPHEMLKRISIWLICAVTLGLNLATISSGKAASFTNTGSLTYTLILHQATLLTNGQVLVSGGEFFPNGFAASTDSELYNPNLGTWTPTGILNYERFSHTATLLTNGQVLIAGGFVFGTAAIYNAEIYNPATSGWTETGRLTNPRGGHTATLLPNGNVLVAGGIVSGSPSSSTEEYNPTTGQWTLTGPMQIQHAYHTATLLPNGKVLIAGGNSVVGGILTFSEIYDPATGRTTRVGNMNLARELHTATLLANGKVLVAGGWKTSGYLSGCELYDPASGTWTNTGSMSVARAYHSAALLTNGYALVVGGKYSNSNVLSSAELYDPTTGFWGTTATMSSARFSGSATLLPNGKVLVAAGGYYCQPGYCYPSAVNGFPLSTAELYDFGVVPAGYNQIAGRITNLGNVQLSYIGMAGWNYALDRSFSLSPASWIPQATNPADANGNLVFTNTPNSATNNFWRIRSVP
jgi:hypothetical protein